MCITLIAAVGLYQAAGSYIELLHRFP